MILTSKFKPFAFCKLFAMFKFAEISRHASQDARISIDDGDDGDDADDGADVDDTREYKIKFIRFA